MVYHPPTTPHDPDAPLPRGFTHRVLYGVPGGPMPPECHGDHIIEQNRVVGTYSR